VPISELRREYAAAKVCVIPLHDVKYSSGQTILLEMLASGARVVVSDVGAVQDYIAGCESVTRVPTGDVEALGAAIRGQSSVAAHSRGVDHVRAGFTSANFEARLAGLIFDVVGGRERADVRSAGE
jgi:glycosyltransferase involved in cell wall biosynthesis